MCPAQKGFRMTSVAENAVIRPPVATGKLARSWFILVPLLYYANSGFPGAADTATAADVSRTHQVGLLTVSLISSVLIAKKIAEIFASSVRLKLIIALPVWAILSSVWSVDPRQSLVSGITLLCFTLFVIYLTEAFSFGGQLDLIMLTGAVAVPASIVLALFVPSVGATLSGWRGIFAHKQQCAAAVTLFLVTAFHWEPNRAIQKPLRVIYIVLCILVIVMSQSRTGWLLALLALVLTGALRVLQRFAAKDAFFIVLTAIPIISGLAYLISLLATLILTSVGKDPTLSDRTTIWSAVWYAITQHPWLGYGYEAFWKGLAGASKDVVFIAGWSISQAQNGYLDLWVQIGIGGIIVLALTIGQALKNAFSSFRGTENPAFVRWCIVVIFCNLVYNIGESDFAYLRILWLLFVLACVGLKKEASYVEQSERQELKSRDRFARPFRLKNSFL
jgi:exopolysaccharide production protein ExoQ